MENKIMIEKYKKLIAYFYHLSKQTDVPVLAETSREFVVDFISKLAKYEKKDRAVYEKMIEKVNGDKTKFVYEETNSTIPDNVEPVVENEIKEVTVPVEVSEVNKEKEYIDYVTKEVYSDSTLKEELGRLEEKLVEDFNNPNKELIEVWVRNYKDFVVRNNLNNDYMVQYMVSMFTKYDKNNDYINNIEATYEAIDLKEPDKEKEENTVTEVENSEEKKITEPEVTEDKKITEIETPEDKTKVEIENKEKEENTVTELEQNKDTGSVENKSSKNDERLSTEPIEIVSIKKPFFNRTEKIGLGVAALACLSTPFITPAVLAGYMFYKLRKNHQYKNHDLEKFLKDNNLSIKDNKLKHVIDTGKTEKKEIEGEMVEVPVFDYENVTEQTVGKVQYEELKKELMNMGAIKSGLIPDEYKKNRLLQIFMNLKPIQRIKNVRKRRLENYKKVSSTSEYFEKKDTNESMWDIIKSEFDLTKNPDEEIKMGMRGL